MSAKLDPLAPISGQIYSLEWQFRGSSAIDGLLRLGLGIKVAQLLPALIRDNIKFYGLFRCKNVTNLGHSSFERASDARLNFHPGRLDFLLGRSDDGGNLDLLIGIQTELMR